MREADSSRYFKMENGGPELPQIGHQRPEALGTSPVDDGVGIVDAVVVLGEDQVQLTIPVQIEPVDGLKPSPGGRRRCSPRHRRIAPGSGFRNRCGGPAGFRTRNGGCEETAAVRIRARRNPEADEKSFRQWCSGHNPIVSFPSGGFRDSSAPV